MSSVFTRPMKSLWIILLTASLVLSILVVSHQPARAGGVLYAAPDGVGDCSSWANACTLQEALSDALSGDQIWVQTGVYVPGAAREDSFALKSGVAIYGGFTGTETALEQRDWEANPTILSGDIDGDDLNEDGNFIAETVDDIVGNNSYHIVVSDNVEASAVLDGFVITAGQANGDYMDDLDKGGGVCNVYANPSMINLNFTGNWSVSGGSGMYNFSSSPILTNVTFYRNSQAMSSYFSPSGGGGLFNNWNSNPTLKKIRFINNSGSDGGGMYNYYSNPTLSDVTFQSNRAFSSGGGIYHHRSDTSLSNVTFLDNTAVGGSGGGMVNFSSNLTLTGVDFSNNTAHTSGGGIYNYSSSLTMTNGVFSGNTANDNGGGILNWEISNTTLTNIIFSNNSAEEGGGLYNIVTNPILSNTTFYNNNAKIGGGICNYYSNVTLTNSILWENTATNSGSQIYNSYDSFPVITYSDVQGGWTGKGNIDSDPLFINMAFGNLRLQYDSPAVDVGSNAAVPSGITTDLDGNPRFVDISENYGDGGSIPVVDMGAFEAFHEDVTILQAFSPSVVGPGESISLTLTLANVSDIPTTSLILTDTLPSVLDGSIVISQGLVITETTSIPVTVWNVQDLSPGESGNILITGNLLYPLTAGVYRNLAILEYALDDGSRYVFSEIGFTVSNVLPVFTSNPLINAAVEMQYTYMITANDDNGDDLIISATTLPSWLALTDHGDGTATLSGVPGMADLGDNSVVLQVSDGDELVETQSFKIKVRSDVIFVDHDASGTVQDGVSWASAYLTLQSALAAALPGNDIWVAEGIYTPGSAGDRLASFELKSGVAVYGGFAGIETDLSERDWKANQTILSGDIAGDDVNHDGNFIAETIDDIQGNNSYHVVVSDGVDASSELNGFIVTAGQANGIFGSDLSLGGGIASFTSNHTLTNLIFSGNWSNGGGGMYNRASSPALMNVIFVNNFAYQKGGGIYNDSSSPTLINVTFFANSADYGGGISNDNSSPTLTNTILWNNTAISQGAQIDDSSDSTSYVTYSDVEGGYSGEGNIDSDPKFVDVSSGRLTLRYDSPAIDAGNNAAVPPQVNTDLGGGPRFNDLIFVQDTGEGVAPLVDMGAYEVHYYSEIIYVDQDAPGPFHDGTSWAKAFTGLQTALVLAQPGNEIWAAEGVYTPGIAGDRLASFELKIGLAVYGGFNGTETAKEQRNWEANRTILSGDIARDDINTDGNHIAETTADIVGSNSYHVVTSNGVSETTILDGFIITAGYADGEDENQTGGGIYNASSQLSLTNLVFNGNFGKTGGGIYNYNSSPTLTNFTFSGNSSGMTNYSSSPTLTTGTFSNHSGRGMYNNHVSSPILTDVTFDNNSSGGMLNYDESSPVLVNVNFSNNSSTSGGGMYNREKSNPILTNVIFYDNSAESIGGGIFNDDSSPSLTNVTLVKNTAELGGGIFNTNAWPNLSNVILWENTATMEGAQIYNSIYSFAVVSYSIVQGGYIGDGNIDADPLFVDKDSGDLRLLPGSPAIDAGSNDVVPAEITTDFDGNPRFADILSVLDTGNGSAPIVDMGAYEANFAEMNLSQVISPIAIRPGEKITFTLTLTNTGSIPTTQITLTDILPAFLEDVAVAADSLVITDTTTIPPYVWRVQNLSPGQSGSLTVSGNLVVPLVSGVYTNTASLEFAPDGGAPDLVSEAGFTVLNLAPFFSSTPVTSASQDVAYTYMATAGDDNGDDLTITATTIPTWLALTDHGDGTAILFGTPGMANIGDHSVVLQVVDVGGLTETQSFTIQVYPAAVNVSPTFTSTPITSAVQGVAYTYQIAASDANGDALLFTALTLPTWLTLTDHGNGTATLSGTPGEDNAGENPVLLQVEDTGGLMDSQSFSIYVNVPPSFTSTPLTSAVQDASYGYHITTHDDNGDELTITAPPLPGWLTLIDHGDGTGFLMGTPGAAELGEHTVVLQVIDSGGLMDTQTFTITVYTPYVNLAPSFTSTPLTLAVQDVVYIYSIAASDANGDELMITAPTLPAWLVLTDGGDGTAMLMGTPGEANVGDHPVVLQVADTDGLTGIQSFTIRVAHAPSNTAPVFTSSPTTSAVQDVAYNYLVIAEDDDGDPLTITAPTLPGWLILTDHGDGTATLSGTPGEDDLGEHDVLLQVADSGGLAGTQFFSIWVEPASIWIYLPGIMK